MAIITVSTRVSSPVSKRIYEKATSDAALLGDSVELANPISEELPHVFIGVQMFDAQGDLLPGGDSAGTFTVLVKTANTKVYEAPPSNVIDATAPTTISVAGNITDVQVVPAALVTTVTYKVIITANGT